jgi:hypothetical protein
MKKEIKLYVLFWAAFGVAHEQQLQAGQYSARPRAATRRFCRHHCRPTPRGHRPWAASWQPSWAGGCCRHLARRCLSTQCARAPSSSRRHFVLHRNTGSSPPPQHPIAPHSRHHERWAMSPPHVHRELSLCHLLWLAPTPPRRGRR